MWKCKIKQNLIKEFTCCPGLSKQFLLKAAECINTLNHHQSALLDQTLLGNSLRVTAPQKCIPSRTLFFPFSVCIHTFGKNASMKFDPPGCCHSNSYHNYIMENTVVGAVCLLCDFFHNSDGIRKGTDIDFLEGSTNSGLFQWPQLLLLQITKQIFPILWPNMLSSKPKQFRSALVVVILVTQFQSLCFLSVLLIGVSSREENLVKISHFFCHIQAGLNRCFICLLSFIFSNLWLT